MANASFWTRCCVHIVYKGDSMPKRRRLCSESGTQRGSFKDRSAVEGPLSNECRSSEARLQQASLAVYNKTVRSTPFLFLFLESCTNQSVRSIPYIATCACMLTRFDAHKSGIPVKPSITASYLEICLYQLYILYYTIFIYIR